MSYYAIATLLLFQYLSKGIITLEYSNPSRAPKWTLIFIETLHLQSVRFPAGGQQQFVTRPAPAGTPAASSGSGQTPAQTFPFAPTEASSQVCVLNCLLVVFMLVHVY